MKEVFEIIKSNMLFDGIEFSDFTVLYNCLNFRVQSFNKKEIIFLSGDIINLIGILITGSAQITKEDSTGNMVLVSEILPGEMFGEAFVCAGISHSPVTVTAIENSKIIFFDFKKIFPICKNSCSFHNKLIENMLKIIATKNMYLNKKIDILSKKTIREKVLCFLDYAGKGQKNFTVNFNREEMASFIAADRSAMCAELSRMQKSGLIRYNKNSFELLAKGVNEY